MGSAFQQAIAIPKSSWREDALFPLTQALSHRERVQHQLRVRQSRTPRFAEARRLALPLPRGEGRGEGKMPRGIGKPSPFPTFSKNERF